MPSLSVIAIFVIDVDASVMMDVILALDGLPDMNAAWDAVIDDMALSLILLMNELLTLDCFDRIMNPSDEFMLPM